MSSPKVLVLAKKSALRVHQEGGDVDTHARVEQLLLAHDETVSRMQHAHEQHEATIDEVQENLTKLGCEVQLFMASTLGSFREINSSTYDLVVTVGGDGTLLAASHAVANVPVLAVNSAPNFSVGFFAGACAGSTYETFQKALEQKLPITPLTRMQVIKNGTLLTKRILNEALVCSASPAATSRYLLHHKGELEEQKSSGLWIGPAAGSTAAQRSAGGRVLPLTSSLLQFVVREPYTPADRALKFVCDVVPYGETLRIRIKMNDGCIFMDGPHEVHAIIIGDTIEFSASDEPLHLVGVVRRKGWRSAVRYST